MHLIAQFDEIARARPDALALASSRGRLDYAHLRARVIALAEQLQAAGVEPDEPVGIAVPRSIESLLAVLGVLWAGGAYVPIDPNYPAERQRWTAQDAGARVLIVASELAVAPEWAGTATLVDVSTLQPAPLDSPARPSTRGELLNILYTSGSTGRPKGVCGTIAAMLNRLAWGWATFPFGEHEVVGHRSSLNFVDAGPEMFAGLLRGVPTAVLLPEEQADLGRFVAALEQHGVTRLTVVPSILAALVRSVERLGERLARLRTWITSGEELTLGLLQAFRAAHPSATLINLYGTTEVTGDVTWVAFRPGEPLPRERVPIGASMADAELLVLDASGKPADEGELYVGGPVLARGYHRRPQEEAVRFPRHPSQAGARCFRTGDLVRRQGEQLLYLGRADNLVKIRGIRIELEEIERALRPACPGVADLAVVLAQGERLIAFAVLPGSHRQSPPASAASEQVFEAAARLLPEAMRPTRVIVIEALPLLPNGKCDRRSLAARVHVEARELAPERLPATPLEQRVAALWAPLVRRDDIARDDTFAELGGDSLALAELLAAYETLPGTTKIDLAIARDGTLAEVARALGGEAVTRTAALDPDTISLQPFADAVDDPEVIAMFVTASSEAALCAATELPWHMDEARAREYCRTSDGVVIRVAGTPVGAGIVQHCPNIGEGVEVPAGAVQLDEWLLPPHRGRGILGEAGAWPKLAAWLAARFDTEVSVTWEDHVAMLAILRARGYTRVGRSYWRSTPEGDGTEGWCEVWTYDLTRHRG
jgi:amino acid adenylation domain-containing protein